MDTFGTRLRCLREQEGYNQKQFADAIGVTPTRLNYWEKDKREPDFHNIRKIIDTLNCDADLLLGINPLLKMSNEQNEDEKFLLLNYRALNREGQEKVIEYVDDLVNSGKHQRNRPPEMAKNA